MREELKSELSAPLQMLDLVYANACSANGHSWERINHAMSGALQIAIGAGFRFDIDDWGYIRSHWNSGYWLGSDVERWYTEAVSSSNKSMIDSYEKLAGREPFIADDVTPMDAWTGSRQRERLAVGSIFSWQGSKVRVNSFSSDGTAVNCTDDLSYEQKKTVKPKRYKITRKMIIDDRADRKEREKLFYQLSAAADKPGAAKKILKDLGIKTRDEKLSVPIEKLREVAAKYCKE